MTDGAVIIDVDLNLKGAEKDVDTLDEKILGLNKSGEKGSLGVKKIATALGLVQVAGKAIGMIKGSIDSAFGRIDTMESFQRVMTALTGDTSTANEVLNTLKTTTKGTAYGLDTAAKAVQGFVTRGVEIPKATKYFEAFGNAVSFYGDGSKEQLENVSDALGKMLSKGKVSMDQMDRLTDAGIDGVGTYAKATGKSVETVQEELSKGSISATDFVDTVSTAFQEGTNGVVKIAGASKEAGATWNAVFTNMRAAVTRGVVAIIQAIDEGLKSIGLKDMRATIASFGSFFEGTLNKVATAIPILFQKASMYLTPFAKMFKEIFSMIGAELSPIFNAAKQNILEFFQSFDNADTLKLFEEYAKNGTEAVKKFIGFIKENKDNLIQLVPVVKAAALAFLAFKTMNVVNNQISILKQGFGLLSSSITRNGEIAMLFGRNFSSGFKLAGKAISPLTNSVKKMGEEMFLAFSMPGPYMANMKSNIANLGTTAVSSFKSFGTALLHPISSMTKLLGLFNPIGLAIAAVVVAVASMAYAFKTNFMNIQGFLKSAFSGMLESLASLKTSFTRLGTNLKPVMDLFKNLAKWLGVGLFVALTVAVSVLVDGFRVLAASLMALVSLFKALALSMKAAWQAMTFDFKGAKKTFGQATEEFKNAGKTMKEAFDPANSATLKTVKSMERLGSTTAKAGEKAAMTTDQIKSSMKSMEEGTERSKNSISKSIESVNTLLNESVSNGGEGLSAQTERFLNAVNDLYGKYQKNAESANQKYNEQMKIATDSNEKDKKEIINKASQELANSTKENNGKLIAINQDYSRMLKENRWSDGIALNEDQRRLLEDQSNAIRDELVKQNELYAEMQLQRIAQGTVLSEQEKVAAVAVQASLYEERARSLQDGEATLAQLRADQAAAEDETVKANYASQIAAQLVKNNEMSVAQSNWGAEMNAIIANGGTLNAQTWGAGMQAMGDVTDEKLIAMTTAFNNETGTIDANLQGFAQIMEIRGGDGAQGFINAIMAGDYFAAGASMNDDITASIANLPPELFEGGAQGRDQFITAMKSGDYKSAGTVLVGGIKQGTEPLKKDLLGVADDSSDGMINRFYQKDPLAEAAGKSFGGKYSGGVSSKQGDSNSSGEGLAKNALDGLVTGDPYSKGSDFGAGYASGISSQLETVRRAAASLAAEGSSAVQKEQKSHSPSKVTRGLGNDFSDGYSLGIQDQTKDAINAAKNLTSSVANIKLPKVVAESAMGINSRMNTSSSNVSNSVTTNNYLSAENKEMLTILKEIRDKSADVFLDKMKVSREVVGPLDSMQGQRMNLGEWGLEM